MNPNAKVSDEFLPAIEAKFGEDLKLKKDSEKVTIKLKEIIEMNSKKKANTQEDDEIPEKEVVIKTNSLAEEKPVAQETPAPAPAPAPAAFIRRFSKMAPPVLYRFRHMTLCLVSGSMIWKFFSFALFLFLPILSENSITQTCSSLPRSSYA